MSLDYLIEGMIIGFSIAAPVGPIGVLCVRRTLAKGRLFGFVSGLGAATADAVYGCVAALGLTFISNVLISQQQWTRLAGGLFLCWLGVRTFTAEPADGDASPTENRLAGAFGSTFVLTLTNPMTILAFGAIFAGLGVASTGGDYVSSGLLVLGVFLGSALWWLTLSGTVGVVRSKLDRRALRWVNRIAGIVIGGFGLLALLSLTG